MRAQLIAAIALAALTGCAHQQYWVRTGTDLRQTASDLNECRLAANAGGQKVFSPLELESPCMVSKGYALSSKPPAS